jgi:hypothetical protein
MIWLFPTPSPVKKAQAATYRKTEKERQLADRKGGGEEPNHTTAGKPGPPEIIQYSLAQTLVTVQIVVR